MRKASVIVILILISVYCFLLFGVPRLFSSGVFIKNLIKGVEQKTELQIALEGLKASSSPSIVYNFKIDKLIINKESKNLADIQNLNFVFDIKTLKFNKISAGRAFLDEALFKKKTSPKEKRKSFNFKNLPKEAKIDELVYFSNYYEIKIENLICDKSAVSFMAQINSPLADKKIYTNNIKINLAEDSAVLDDFTVFAGKGRLNLKGEIKKTGPNLKITGADLPVGDIERAVLYFQKKKDNSKKFLENFKNFKGDLDLDLSFNNEGLFGECKIKNLYAETVLFNAPVRFNNAVFNFNKNEMTSVAKGTIGGEEITHSVTLKNLWTPDLETKGEVTSLLTGNFRYIPELDIKDKVKVLVVYNVKNKKVLVDYLLNVAPGADIFYKNIFLGLKSKSRKFKATTLKDGNKIYIKNYSYLLSDGGKESLIIKGDGLLEKKGGKYKPSFFNCKTNGYAPVSVIGSLGRYIYGGKFNGDLKFDIENEKLYGNFEIINTRFKDFRVKSAKIIARDKIKIAAEGLYHRQKFTCDLEAKNQFGDSPFIYNLNLFLDKFIIKGAHPSKPDKTKHKVITSKIRKLNITIQNWNIKLNKIIKDRIVLENIMLFGALQDNVFCFTMEDLAFAKGVLSANGEYNFNDDSSCIHFQADNIDSDYVADIIFDLPGQIEGVANANLYLKTKDNLKDIKAKGEFSMTNGYLPQLGDTEFMVKKFKNGKKFKISDLTNLDFSLKKELSADVNGSFYLNNDLLEDINITTQQKAFASYINGTFDTKTRRADLCVYGKYDKEMPKKYKILFMPLDWVLGFLLRDDLKIDSYKDKIQKIPAVSSKKNNERLFRVKIDGNLNTQQVNVDIKGLR